ncbi:hypothetical protein E2562_005850 [Oryza meyeriana var. granulata]|uniref:Uncharacterized protein n=1 Tax=Oryza meyeriana var. granulata TaxID=110450 RepID=A0A6G1CDY1_9ORYZ|nr:hypothetical protein E2562_005850 [Oryza meyeriana var. granulata]
MAMTKLLVVVVEGHFGLGVQRRGIPPASGDRTVRAQTQTQWWFARRGPRSPASRTTMAIATTNDVRSDCLGYGGGRYLYGSLPTVAVAVELLDVALPSSMSPDPGSKLVA